MPEQLTIIERFDDLVVIDKPTNVSLLRDRSGDGCLWDQLKAETEFGKPYLLHSCGNLDAIMDDLIETVGIDGKHSFEDTILPVTEAYRRYGQKISILGGVDVDFLCRASEMEIRSRVRETLDACTSRDHGKGICFGTGNTVANYIPLDNYLIMLDEGRKHAL